MKYYEEAYKLGEESAARDYEIQSCPYSDVKAEWYWLFGFICNQK